MGHHSDTVYQSKYTVSKHHIPWKGFKEASTGNHIVHKRVWTSIMMISTISATSISTVENVIKKWKTAGNKTGT